jgi:Carboxypeptidase regulatory-like domain
MKHVGLVIAVLAATAHADDRVSLSGRVVDTTTEHAVEGALVYVGGAGFERAVTTDRNGRYSVEVPPGTYHVIFAHGSSRSTAEVVIGAASAHLDAKVDAEAGEVIVVEDRTAPAKAKNHKPLKAPPYSDEAVLTDAWTRAWLLLDVDERGHVVRLKFLKHPGYDLEAIARGEAFKLEFEPARDASGKPIRTWVVWDIEWPSAWWLSTFVGTRASMPPIVGFPPRRLDSHVPCYGSGPLHLGSVHPVYKDCSKPDLTRAAVEPWVTR